MADDTWDETGIAWLVDRARQGSQPSPTPAPFLLPVDDAVVWQAGAMLWVLGHRGFTPPMLVEMLNLLTPPQDRIGGGLRYLAYAWDRLVARHPRPPDPG
jgi:hypothetical protein